MKIKEKILKLGKRKNCFIALLLCVLLAFTIISGLNGSKSGEIKANAQTAPQTKNLDLNGVRYTYQTSLKELKNNYGFFNNPYTNEYFTFVNNNEGENLLRLRPLTDYNYTQEEINSSLNIVKNSIKFYNNKTEILNNVTLDNSKIPLTDYPIYSFDGENNFKNVNNIYIDFKNLRFLPKYDNDKYDGSIMINLYYFIENYDASKFNDIDYILKNQKIVSYILTRPSNINFKLPLIKGYNFRMMLASSLNTSEQNTEHQIKTLLFSNVLTSEALTSSTDAQMFIDNISFEKNDVNAIKCESVLTDDIELTMYKGNILLSESNYDKQMIERFNDISKREDLTYTFFGGCYLGGNFDNSHLVNTLTYTYSSPLLLPGGSTDRIDVDILGRSINENINPNQGENNNLNQFVIMFNNNNALLSENNFIKIKYFNQNRLIYLPKYQNLRMNSNGYSGKGLGAQVEDILYNVNYVGNIEEIEFNEKVEEDFQNLLKLTGLGAFIGLVLGLIFGNTALGAAIGAIWGALIALFPLLIDGLQALFGYNFLSGLYNFFKSITNFFANFVDTIINFFVSIITNPFVLILIVIVAIIFVITYFQKK